MKDALGDLSDFSKGELAKIATTKWLGRTTRVITNAIAQSFAEDVVLRSVQTQSEIKRRFTICAKTVVLLRRDLGWSMPRIFDEIPIALRSALDGIPWDPSAPKRKMWASTDPG